jgi:hypothetical protein
LLNELIIIKLIHNLSIYVQFSETVLHVLHDPGIPCKLIPNPGIGKLARDCNPYFIIKCNFVFLGEAVKFIVIFKFLTEDTVQ